MISAAWPTLYTLREADPNSIFESRLKIFLRGEAGQLGRTAAALLGGIGEVVERTVLKRN
jgi:hypothetical protein